MKFDRINMQHFYWRKIVILIFVAKSLLIPIGVYFMVCTVEPSFFCVCLSLIWIYSISGKSKNMKYKRPIDVHTNRKLQYSFEWALNFNVLVSRLDVATVDTFWMGIEPFRIYRWSMFIVEHRLLGKSGGGRYNCIMKSISGFIYRGGFDNQILLFFLFREHWFGTSSVYPAAQSRVHQRFNNRFQNVLRVLPVDLSPCTLSEIKTFLIIIDHTQLPPIVLKLNSTHWHRIIFKRAEWL